MVLITKTSDYERWVKQGRDDILKYSSPPPVDGYGDFWAVGQGNGQADYCPFANMTDDGIYACSIEDTKPEVCRKFYCEWAFGEGKKGVPFLTESGWTDKAIRLGYGKQG